MESSRIFHPARWFSVRSLKAIVACVALLSADQGCQHIGAARAGHTSPLVSSSQPLGDQDVSRGRAFDDGLESARKDQKRAEDREWRYRNRRWSGSGRAGYYGQRR